MAFEKKTDDEKKKKKAGPPASEKKPPAGPPPTPEGEPDGDEDIGGFAPEDAGPPPDPGAQDPTAGLPPDLIAMLLGGMGGPGGSPLGPQAMQPGAAGPMGPPLMPSPSPMGSPPMAGAGGIDPRLLAALGGGNAQTPGTDLNGGPGSEDPKMGLAQLLEMLQLAQSGAGRDF